MLSLLDSFPYSFLHLLDFARFRLSVSLRVQPALVEGRLGQRIRQPGRNACRLRLKALDPLSQRRCAVQSGAKLSNMCMLGPFGAGRCGGPVTVVIFGSQAEVVMYDRQ